MKTNNVTKTLLKTDRKALRVLSGVFGFNFEADFIAAEVDVPFTVNKINKFLTERGIDPRENKTIILIQSTIKWRSDYIMVAEILPHDFSINFRTCDSGLYSTKLDEYRRRGDFNEDRRQEGGRAYIITQNKNNLILTYKHREPFDINENTRYILKDAPALWAWNRATNKSYMKYNINRVEITLPNMLYTRTISAECDVLSMFVFLSVRICSICYVIIITPPIYNVNTYF